ncbi:hypothetical protein FQN49_004184 [Arthroderma sp. PD_2]|nr:hypothetical protein FQN49_004184 [Arthroderma sp. PD_2]
MIFLRLSAILVLLSQALALPYPGLPVYNVTGEWVDPIEFGRQSRADKVPLRILPLGASIMQGKSSSDGNGFRKSIRLAMRAAGYRVNMVGSKRDGTMWDNDNEGWPGFVIDEVRDKAKSQYKVKPNLILVNAGTNDCRRFTDYRRQPARLEALLEDLFENIPEVTVLLSGLLPNKDYDECSKLQNSWYRGVSDKLERQGRKIVFADTYNGYLTMKDLKDGIHPNDTGYRKFASIWWVAFTTAVKKGYVTPPSDSSSWFGASFRG